MSSIFSLIKPDKKPSWQIIAPLLLVMVLAAGWSVYWLVASARAMDMLDQVLAREKAKGLEISCARREMGGYPFKFLLTCDKLNIIRQTPLRQTGVTAQRLVVVVQAYNFNHMIGELYGPFEVTTGRPDAPAGQVRKLFSGTAKTIRSSLILKNRVLKQATVVIRGLSGTLVDYSNKGRPQNIATELNEAIVHVRSTGDTSRPIGDYEAASVVKGLLLVGGPANIQSEKGLQFENFRARVKVSNAPYQLTGNLLDWLKIWKANKGEAVITQMNATSGSVKLEGAGHFNLDNLGRAQGVLNTRMTGLDSLINELVASGRIREKDANLGLAAINLLGNAGAGGVKVALRAQKGNVYFGPFKVAILKPLFVP